MSPPPDGGGRRGPAETLDALARLGARVQQERTPEAVEDAVRDGLLGLGLACALLRPEPDGFRHEWARAPGAGDAVLAAAGFRDPLPPHPPTPELEAVWQEGARFVEDLPLAVQRFHGGATGARGRDAARAAGLAHAVAVRLGQQAGDQAVLLVMGGWLRAGDVPAFRLFGSQVTGAREASRVIADLSTRNAELAARNRIVEVSATAPSLAEFFARGAEVVRETLGCDVVAVWLHDAGPDELVLGHAVGGTPELKAAYGRTPVEGSHIGRVLRDGRSTLQALEEVPEPARSLLRASPYRSFASVPLRIRSRRVGVLSAGFRDGPAPGRLPLLEALAGPFAAAVEAQQLVEDLRRSYAELERTQRQLVQRERLAALGELSASLAHEVRNPLAVMFNSLGSLQRILRPQGDAKLLLDVIQEEADRLNRIVGDLLDFARPAEPSLRPASMVRVVEDALGAALAHGPASVALVRELDPSLPPVPLDERQVRQAVLNLAVNAVQAMPRGGTLSVRLRRDGALARLEVADTGPGVAPEDRQRVFEPFFTTRATGTGLGLAVVKRIAEGHGGTVEVGDAPGGGACFVLRLPLPAPAEVDSRAPFR